MHPLIDEMQSAMELAGADSTEDRPKLHIDGKRVDLSASSKRLTGIAARLASVNDKTFGPIAERLDVERLIIAEMRGGDISALAHCRRLTHLNITWAPKLHDISPLAQLDRLECLELTDTPKITDISALSNLKKLRVLLYRGGIWNANRAETLEPLAGLDRLQVLVLQNLRVSSGGLRPLAVLSGLRALFLSNQFDTADYAYLAVHLPRTTCDKFAPFEVLSSEIGGCDVLVTGKRKPFLDSRKPADQVRLEKYVQAFEKLKARFSAEA
ncbi:MAG: hypothetical protein HKN18_09500 [Silicimonas sp.]|nr:hypothetical protein [Silicimonas sp.]